MRVPPVEVERRDGPGNRGATAPTVSWEFPGWPEKVRSGRRLVRGPRFGEAAAFASRPASELSMRVNALDCANSSAPGRRVDMGAFVEDQPRGLDGVTDAFDAGDAAGAESAPSMIGRRAERGRHG